MKSTGCGGRGFVWSTIPTCSSVRSPLRRLQGAQAVTTFSQTDSPPFDRGTTWSRVSRPPAVAREERLAGDLALDRPRDADVVEEPDHVRPDEAAGGRAERLVELLDDLRLALVEEHVGAPNRAHIQRLVTGVQNQNLLHPGRKGTRGFTGSGRH